MNEAVAQISAAGPVPRHVPTSAAAMPRDLAAARARPCSGAGRRQLARRPLLRLLTAISGPSPRR